MGVPNPVLIESQDAEHGRWLVRTACAECFIEVSGQGGDDYGRWVQVSLLSSHLGRKGDWTQRQRWRALQAWRVLRGRGRDWLELNTEEEAEALLAALVAARALAWPQEPDYLPSGPEPDEFADE